MEGPRDVGSGGIDEGFDEPVPGEGALGPGGEGVDRQLVIDRIEEALAELEAVEPASGTETAYETAMDELLELVQELEQGV